MKGINAVQYNINVNTSLTELIASVSFNEIFIIWIILTDFYDWLVWFQNEAIYYEEESVHGGRWDFIC